MSHDVIEREVFINAGIDHVWSLVSKNGFWVGEELHFEVEARVGETAEFDVPNYGRFPVRVEQLDPPHYAAYRWASAYPGQELSDENTTLVEFMLSEQDGGVKVQVRESGFDKLSPPDFREARYNENVGGWEGQLEALRRVAEGVRAK